jgi:hypothetical protein
VDDWPLLERNTPRAFFKNTRVDRPAARLRLDSPHAVVRRFSRPPPDPGRGVRLRGLLMEQERQQSGAQRARADATRRGGSSRGAPAFADAARRGGQAEALALHERAAAQLTPLRRTSAASLLKLEVARRASGSSPSTPGAGRGQRSVELARIGRLPARIRRDAARGWPAGGGNGSWRSPPPPRPAPRRGDGARRGR